MEETIPRAKLFCECDSARAAIFSESKQEDLFSPENNTDNKPVFSLHVSFHEE